MESSYKPWNDQERLSESVSFIASLVPKLNFSADANWRRQFIKKSGIVEESANPLELIGSLAGIMVEAAEKYLRWEHENEPEAPIDKIKAIQDSLELSVSRYFERKE